MYLLAVNTDEIKYNCIHVCICGILSLLLLEYQVHVNMFNYTIALHMLELKVALKIILPEWLVKTMLVRFSISVIRIIHTELLLSFLH